MPITIEEANLNDLPALSRLRAEHWGTANEWEPRITAYMIHQQTPQFGLQPRTVLVAVDSAENEVVGLIAGHLTTRLGCTGELQWLNVDTRYRGRRIADQLINALFAWFREQNATRICVNVAPSNRPAREVYARYQAEVVDPHWLRFDLTPEASN